METGKILKEGEMNMENTVLKETVENGALNCCRHLVNPYSLLNLELTGKKIRPLRWLLGFLLVSQFVVAFAYIDSSYYFVSVLKFSILAVLWVLGTVLIENGIINHYTSEKGIRYLDRVKMMLVSITLWSVALFLYITLFLV